MTPAVPAAIIVSEYLREVFYGKEESNYDIMARQAQERFLTFDQQPIIRKFQLRSDSESIYLSFSGSPYRIRRKDGHLLPGRQLCPKRGI